MRGSAVVPSPPGVVAAMWLSMTLAMSLLLGEHNLREVGSYAFGGAVVWFLARREQQRKEDFAIGRLPRSQRTAVHRAVDTGVAPGDPWLREAALDLASFRLTKTARGNTFLALVVLSLLLVVSLFYAVTDPSLDHAFSAVMCGLTLALFAAEPAWRRRRVARLEQTINHLAHPAYR